MSELLLNYDLISIYNEYKTEDESELLSYILSVLGDGEEWKTPNTVLKTMINVILNKTKSGNIEESQQFVDLWLANWLITEQIVEFSHNKLL